MDSAERKKMERIARQATNIKLMELSISEGYSNSDGESFFDSSISAMAIYNVENISTEEVLKKIENGTYAADDRILITDMGRAYHIFPHARDKKTGTYWKLLNKMPIEDRCKCSNCGFTLPRHEVTKFDMDTGDYDKLRYRFCPNCGAVMSEIKEEEED